MTDYNEIYNKMEPSVQYTAAALSVAAASLTAMVRRNMVTKIEGKPNKYVRVENSKYSKIIQLVRENIGTRTYFGAKFPELNKPMFCSIRDGKILNCYDVNWTSRADEIEYLDICNKIYQL